MLRSWRANLRLIAAAVSAIVAAGAFAAANGDYLPATRGYAQDIVKAQINSALNVATARISTLQLESMETRLQINQVRRDSLRADKFTREQQLSVAIDPNTRQLLQQRLAEISDALDDVNSERERLRIPK